MNVSLTVLVPGPMHGRMIPIRLPRFLIGRDPQAQLKAASPAIHNRHCALEVRNSNVFVSDLDSPTGTFVNDARIRGKVQVKHGDRLRVGPLIFGITIVPEPAATKNAAPKQTAEEPREHIDHEESIAPAPARRVILATEVEPDTTPVDGHERPRKKKKKKGKKTSDPAPTTLQKWIPSLHDYWVGVQCIGNPKLFGDYIASKDGNWANFRKFMGASIVLTAAVESILPCNSSLFHTGLETVDKILTILFWLLGGLLTASVTYKPLRWLGGQGGFSSTWIAAVYVTALYYPILSLMEGLYQLIFHERMPNVNYLILVPFCQIVAQIHNLSVGRAMVATLGGTVVASVLLLPLLIVADKHETPPPPDPLPPTPPSVPSPPPVAPPVPVIDDDRIVGKWESVGAPIPIILEFSKDGQLKTTIAGTTITGTYKLNGDIIECRSPGITAEVKVTFHSTIEMVLSNEAGQRVKYWKAGKPQPASKGRRRP